MRMKIELEVEFTEMSEEMRKVCASMAEEATDDLPKLSDYKPYELAYLFHELEGNTDFIDSIFGGSMIYAEIKKVLVRNFEVL